MVPARRTIQVMSEVVLIQSSFRWGCETTGFPCPMESPFNKIDRICSLEWPLICRIIVFTKNGSDLGLAASNATLFFMQACCARHGLDEFIGEEESRRKGDGEKTGHRVAPTR